MRFPSRAKREFKVFQEPDRPYQRIVVKPNTDNPDFQGSALFRAGDPTELLAYGKQKIPDEDYQLSTDGTDILICSLDGEKKLYLTRNRQKYSLAHYNLHNDDSNKDLIPDLWYGENPVEPQGYLIIKSHERKEITSLTLKTIAGDYTPNRFYEWNERCRERFGEAKDVNILSLIPPTRVKRLGQQDLKHGQTYFFLVDGDPIPTDVGYKIHYDDRGEIQSGVGRDTTVEFQLDELQNSQNRSLPENSDEDFVVRYRWKSKSGHSGTGFLRKLSGGVGTVRIEEREPTVLTVLGNFDPNTDYQYTWETTDGEIAGQGQRVNFTPRLAENSTGLAIINFSAHKDSELKAEYTFTVPVSAPRERVILTKVFHEDNRVIVRGHVENVTNPNNYQIAVYIHSDISYEIRGKHIFSLDEEGKFVFQVETNPSLDRLVVYLFPRTRTDKSIAKEGVYYDHHYNTKARLDFEIDGQKTVAFTSYHFHGKETHEDRQIQYLLNRFCKVPVRFKGTSTALKGAQQDPNAPENAFLIRSYDNHDQMYLYDEALAILAFTHAGEKKAAKKILDALKYLQLKKEDDPANANKDGSWYFSYLPDGQCIYPDAPSWHERTQGVWDRQTYDDRRVTGATAWAAMAINAYQLKYKDPDYDDMLDRVITYLNRIRKKVEFNGITSYPAQFQDNDRKLTDWNEAQTFSIEHNLDTYSAFRIYDKLKKSTKYASSAKEVLDFIESLWIGENRGFYVGFGNTAGQANADEVFMDPQSWGLLGLGHDEDLLRKYYTGLERVFSDFFEPAGFKPNGKTGFIGFFDYYPKDVNTLEWTRQFVWTEGTLGVIMAMNLVKEKLGKDMTFKRFGVKYTAQDLLDSMNRIQDEEGGVPYATWNAIPDDFSHDACIAGTTWLYFANHNFNPFDPDFASGLDFPSTEQDGNEEESEPTSEEDVSVTTPIQTELLVDDFNEGTARGKSFERQTSLGIARGNDSICHGTSVRRPDYAVMTKEESDLNPEDKNKMLKIEYKNTKRGWASYYSLLGGEDITKYNALSFWVKGRKGGESFDIGFNDKRMQDNQHDGISIGSVNLFLEAGITTNWQEVLVPLCSIDTFSSAHINQTSMGALVLQFRNRGRGTIYLEDIKFKLLDDVPNQYYCEQPTFVPLSEVPVYNIEVPGEEKVTTKRGEFKLYSFGSAESSRKPFADREVFYDASKDTVANDPEFNSNYETLNLDRKSVRIHYQIERNRDDKIENFQDQSKDSSLEDFQGAYCWISGDLSAYKTLTFLVKGNQGGETFEIGIADEISDKLLTNVKSGSIYRYLPNGITTEWQVVKIPLKDFFGTDLKKTVSLTFDFNEPGSGTFWIDEICFSTENLIDREKEIKEKGYFLLDDFDHSDYNFLGLKGVPFKRIPSECIARRVVDSKDDKAGRCLQLKFDKQKSGWSGYYTMLNHLGGDRCDLSAYSKVSFKVRGERGGEGFEIQMADKKRQETGVSGSAGQISEFLKSGVTTEWQDVVIPLQKFGNLILSQMGTFTINFNKVGTGTIYIDDLKFHLKGPDDPKVTNQTLTNQTQVDRHQIQPRIPDKINIPESYQVGENEGDTFFVDDFENEGVNLAGGLSDTTVGRFSACYASYESDSSNNEYGRILRLDYDKKGGDWCVYYSVLNIRGENYVDLTDFEAVSFKVKGTQGGEQFKIKLADEKFQDGGDTPAKISINNVLPGGVTTQWQEVSIPLKKLRFGLDLRRMGTFSIDFYKVESGTIYIDDLKFHRKK